MNLVQLFTMLQRQPYNAQLHGSVAILLMAYSHQLAGVENEEEAAEYWTLSTGHFSAAAAISLLTDDTDPEQIERMFIADEAIKDTFRQLAPTAESTSVTLQ